MNEQRKNCKNFLSAYELFKYCERLRIKYKMRRVIPVSESALTSYHRSSYAALLRRFFLICSAEKHLNRLLRDFRREHPHLKVLIVEDGLASNYPHLSLLDSLNMDYLVGVKPGDHTYLFDWIKELPGECHTQIDEQGTTHEFCYYHEVPLNDTHNDYRVNVLEYTERKKSGKVQCFSWVRKLAITKKNVYMLMKAARSRWCIENETFNTLKNQGYNFLIIMAMVKSIYVL